MSLKLKLTMESVRIKIGINIEERKSSILVGFEPCNQSHCLIQENRLDSRIKENVNERRIGIKIKSNIYGTGKT